MNAILERLSGLRGAMRTHGISHYLVPSADEHINEYLPRWNARREWLSGFSGSAGDLLVGIDPHETVLFTRAAAGELPPGRRRRAGCLVPASVTASNRSPLWRVPQVSHTAGVDTRGGPGPPAQVCSL